MGRLFNNIASAYDYRRRKLPYNVLISEDWDYPVGVSLYSVSNWADNGGGADWFVYNGMIGRNPAGPGSNPVSDNNTDFNPFTLDDTKPFKFEGSTSFAFSTTAQNNVFGFQTTTGEQFYLQFSKSSGGSGSLFLNWFGSINVSAGYTPGAFPSTFIYSMEYDGSNLVGIINDFTVLNTSTPSISVPASKDYSKAICNGNTISGNSTKIGPQTFWGNE